jgi:hypothetical protein
MNWQKVYFCVMKRKLAVLLILVIALHKGYGQDSLKFTKAQIAGDITYFIKNASEIHPNLYHSISEKQLINKVDSLVRSLPDSLTEFMTYRTFAEVTALINEGHTGANAPVFVKNQINDGSFNAIPFQAIDYDNATFIGNLMIPGAKLSNLSVLSINGLTAANIFNQMTALKGGLSSFRKVSVIKYFRFYLAAIGIKQPYTIFYKDVNHNTSQVTVGNMRELDYLAEISKPKDARDYTFDVVGNATGYLNFKSMTNYDHFVVFCDSVFQTINQRHIRKLIVDLRENGGGNSALGMYLLNYITQKPYRMAGNSERKVSQQFKDQILKPANRQLYGDTYDEYLKMKNGEFWQVGGNDLVTPNIIKNRFTGSVCFLIGPYTFSSANMLAATIKDYNLAPLIGEPTGEPGNDYGELCTIKLPQTGWITFTSTTYWVRPNNNKTDHNAIIPDFLVKRTSSGGDNVLNYALKFIGSTN